MSNNIDVQQQGNSNIQQKEENEAYWDNKFEEKPMSQLTYEKNRKH